VVQVILLTARPDLETNRRLAAAATELGATAVVVDAARVAAVAGEPPSLIWNGADVLAGRPGAVVPRVGNWRPASVLAALEVAVQRGFVSANSPAAIRVGRDHWQTIRALGAAGLPAPGTVAGADPEVLASAAEQRFGFPVVVKHRRSRMGVGVMRCDSRDHLEAVLDTQWRLGDEVVVQQYLESGGVSLRLLVVGGEVVAAARFRAPAGEWRSNGARGATAANHQPSAAERRLAVGAAAALGLGQCGVDLLIGDPPMVLEVNPTPGFRHLEAASGVDAARALMGHSIEIARGGAATPTARG
jgi:RimK family alpha-L-glutamate ligase